MASEARSARDRASASSTWDGTERRADVLRLIEVEQRRNLITRVLAVCAIILAITVALIVVRGYAAAAASADAVLALTQRRSVTAEAFEAQANQQQCLVEEQRRWENALAAVVVAENQADRAQAINDLRLAQDELQGATNACAERFPLPSPEPTPPTTAGG